VHKQQRVFLHYTKEKQDDGGELQPQFATICKPKLSFNSGTTLMYRLLLRARRSNVACKSDFKSNAFSYQSTLQQRIHKTGHEWTLECPADSNVERPWLRAVNKNYCSVYVPYAYNPRQNQHCRPGK
jgi:hypothetical protein